MIFEAIVLMVIAIMTVSPIFVILNIIKDTYEGYILIPIGILIVLSCVIAVGLGVYLWTEFFKFII